RIRRTVTGRSPEEVEEKAAELKAQFRRGMDLSADKITLAQHIDVWLRSKKRSVSSGTHRNYTDRLEYVKDRLGTVTLRDLTENHINEMNEWLADEKEFSPRFIYDINATLRSCIQAAVQPRG